jgi:type II secretory pathway component PulF
VRSLALSRLLGTLSILLKARVPLHEALPVAVGASGSLQLAAEAERLRERIEEGEELGAALTRLGVVPRGLTGYLAVDEKGGRLPEASGELAELLEEQSAALSDTLFTLLFPSALLAVGLVMGVVFVGLIYPYAHIMSQTTG